jgi:hypothetical protein
MARLCSKNDKQFKARIAQMRSARMPAIDKCRDHASHPCTFLENDSDYCQAYMYPKRMWKNGNCPLATHLEVEKSKQGKIRVGQQKQRKMI